MNVKDGRAEQRESRLRTVRECSIHRVHGRSLGGLQIGRNVTRAWAARPSRRGAAGAGWWRWTARRASRSDRSRLHSVMGATGSCPVRPASMAAVAGAAALSTSEAMKGPRLLVVSADPDRRERWARVLAETDHDVSRCVGPTVTCAIVQGKRCPLLEETDIALYDQDAYIPRLARMLGTRHGYRASILVAEDDERGRPAALRRPGSLAAGCFGTPR